MTVMNSLRKGMLFIMLLSGLLPQAHFLTGKAVTGETIRDVLEFDIPNRLHLAAVAHRQGDFRKAAGLYLEVLKYNRRNGLALYNLACCYARLNEYTLSEVCLRQAFECGYDVLGLMAKDEDFAAYRKTASSQKFLREMTDIDSCMGDKHYLIVPRALPYWLHLPPSHTSRKSCSLVIALHGNGGNQSNFRHLVSYFDAEDLILAVPQGLYVHPQDGNGRRHQYTFGLPSRDKSTWKKADLATSEAVAEMAREIKRHYDVDKVYLLGFSEGGVFAYQTVILNPQLFSAALIFGAKIPDLDQPYSLLDTEGLRAGSGVTVFIAHGESDTAMKVDFARQAHKLLKDTGYTVRLQTFDGGHGVPGEVLKSGLRWIRKQTGG